MSTKLVVLLISLFAAAVAGGVGIYYGTREFQEQQAAEQTAAAPQDEPEAPDTQAAPETPDEEVAEAEPEAPAGDAETAEVVPPRLDIIRVEPSGDTVAAGTAAPGATVEMLLGGEVVASGIANKVGDWTLVPDEPLPQGAHDLTFRATGSDGEGAPVIGDRVAVVIEGPDETPMVAVTPPDAPSGVVQRPQSEEPAPREEQEEVEIARAGEPQPTSEAESQQPPRDAGSANAPEASAEGGQTAASAGQDAPEAESEQSTVDAASEEDTAGSEAVDAAPERAKGEASSEASATAEDAPADAARVIIDTVEVDPPADVHVSGAAEPDAPVRVYLNNEAAAETRADDDGNWSATIEAELPPGRYTVRADALDEEGEVEARAEVRFDRVRIAEADGSDRTAEDTQPAAPTGQADAGQETDLAAVEGGESAPDSRDAVAVEVIPGSDVAPVSDTPLEVNIVRGDNLWTIARSIYGRGVRYTVIYEANRSQITDPDLIYPGQIFTVPLPDETDE